MTRLILISKSNIKQEKLASLFIKNLDYFLSQIPNYVIAYVEKLGAASTAKRKFDFESPEFYSRRTDSFTRVNFQPNYYPFKFVRDPKLYLYIQTLNIHENIVYYNNLILGLIGLFFLFSLLILFEENVSNASNDDQEPTIYSLSTVTFVLLNTFVFIIIVFSHNFFKQFIFQLAKHQPESIDEDETPTKPKLSKRQTTVVDVGRLLGDHQQEPDPNLTSISFLLCLFDNIVGPKIVHHWLLDPHLIDHTDEQLLKYIAVHTLNGELYQDKLHSNLKYRLYLIQEVDRAIFSVFFDASTVSTGSSSNVMSNNHSAAELMMSSLESSSSSSGDNMSSSAMKRHHAASMTKLNASATTSLNSFSMIVPLDRKHILMRFYGDATKFFLNAFENMILEFKIYAHVKPKIHQTTKAIDNLTQMLTQFVSNLVTLRHRGLYPCYLSEEDERSRVDFKIHIKDTFLNDCFFTTPVSSSANNLDKQNFLINAITSHLITNYRTIVVGKTSASINKMINTLGLFMPKELLRISCYSLEESSMLSPYFCLQGFVTENPEEIGAFLSADFLFKRDSPTTIVDLSYKQVYRTPILNEFLALKEDFIKKKVKFLYNSLSLEHLNILYPVRVNSNLNWISSSSIAQKSTLITSMLKQMDILEVEDGTKDAYLNMILKDIYMLSVSLIEYVNNELTCQLNASKKDPASLLSPIKVSARKICKDLDIKSDEDLNILIAHANYLKPGFSLDFNLY